MAQELTREHLNMITQHYRSQRLLPRIWEHTQGAVQTGPFEGMLLLRDVAWGDGDLCAKILGIYEDELHLEIERCLEWQPDWCLNLGAAEGYYAVGMAYCGVPSVTAIDTQSNLLEITRRTAQHNGVLDQVGARDGMAPDIMQFLLSGRERPVIISDCEGAELEYLDPVQVPALAHTWIIVESHDCVRPGCTETLHDRFRATHDIRIMRAGAKDVWQFAWLHDLWDIEKLLIASELRPETARWLSMAPRKDPQ